MHRFYQPDIASTLQLSEDESKHCVRVLRLQEGDEIEVVDGCGNLYLCTIAMAHPKRCALTIVQQTACPPHWGHEIVLCVAPTKNLDRIEDMADRVTEMGVNAIIPLLCHNSERKVLKTERLQKILVSAMKQSLKAQLPRLHQLTPFKDVVKMPFEGDKFIAYCDASLPRHQRRLLSQAYRPGTHTMIVIGPEGDFSNEEVEMAKAAGVQPVSLGESRLRTETAAMFAVATCHALDMNQKPNE